MLLFDPAPPRLPFVENDTSNDWQFIAKCHQAISFLELFKKLCTTVYNACGTTPVVQHLLHIICKPFHTTQVTLHKFTSLRA